MLRYTCATVLCALSGAAPSGHGHGYNSSLAWLPREPINGAITADLLVPDWYLPKAWDWRNVEGQNYVTTDWNQHIPQYCGACWIHGTTSALQDRIKMMRKAAFPDVMISRQAIINCVPDPSDPGAPPPGCNGGDPWMVHTYLMGNKVPDETCLPYQARNMGCSAENVCRNCNSGTADPKDCFPVSGFIGYGVSTYGNLSGELPMMREIYARGPIACSFATDDPFMFKYSETAAAHEGVYVTDSKKTEADIDHVMEVAGWGETPSGRKYWVIRNSWGTYWGQNGWVKLERGKNTLLSESDCHWAVPTWGDLDGALQGHVMGDWVRGASWVADEVPGAAPYSTQSRVPTLEACVAYGAVLIAGALATAAWWSRTRVHQKGGALGKSLLD